jgi:LysM repeat protein
MRRSGFAVLALTALVLPLSATAATVTVRSGETLTDIAYRSGVSVGTLMRLNNMSNANYLEAGSQLQVPGPSVSAGKGRHRVKKGETLSRIASQYKVSSRDLMAVNGLRNANHVEVGQNLKLPSNAVLPKPGFKPVAVTPIPGASEHTVAKGQTLTQIAKAYNLPIATLISINDLRNPNKVEVGTRLYLKQPTTVLATQSVPAKASPSQRKPGRQQARQNHSNLHKNCQKGGTCRDNSQNGNGEVSGLENLWTTSGGLGQLATDGGQSGGSNTEFPRPRVVSGSELLRQENQCHWSRWQLETMGRPPKPL